MLRRLIYIVIALYKRMVSPFLPGTCRFHPSCSEYAKQSLERKKLPIALCLILYRLLRCNPLCKGGHDPVK